MEEQIDNIIDDVKSICGVSHLDDDFDRDIFLYTSGAIATVSQIMDTAPGFLLSKNSTWGDLIGEIAIQDTIFHSVKTYVGVRVKSIFDPGNGPTVQFQERYLQEEAFRIGVAYDKLKSEHGDIHKHNQIKSERFNTPTQSFSPYQLHNRGRVN
jgi:hypothetical protein